MAKEKKVELELEAGIPGLAKAKVVGLTKTIFTYSCAVDFGSLEDARTFRAVAEKAVADGRGEISQSNIG